MQRMTIVRRAVSDEMLYGLEIKRNQYIGTDADQLPCIFTLFITDDNKTIVKCRDRSNRIWVDKYYPIDDSSILPMDIVQNLWVKRNRFLEKCGIKEEAECYS